MIEKIKKPTLVVSFTLLDENTHVSKFVDPAIIHVWNKKTGEHNEVKSPFIEIHPGHGKLVKCGFPFKDIRLIQDKVNDIIKEMFCKLENRQNKKCDCKEK